MSLIAAFVGSAQDQKFRIEKPVQHIEIHRWSPLAVITNGLENGFPELVGLEITHPSRARVRQGNDVPLSHMVFFSQHGRGPIAETLTSEMAAPLAAGGGLLPVSSNKSQMFYTVSKIYINDLGPLDLEANDHFFVNVHGAIPGAIYEIYAPEQQVQVAQGNRYLDYEVAVLLASDREPVIEAKGAQALILPNAPDTIVRLVLTNVAGQETELYLPELCSVQTDTNPITNTFSIQGGGFADDPETRSQPSRSASLLLIMLQSLDPATYGQQLYTKIQVDKVLGSELRYTLVTVKDRVG